MGASSPSPLLADERGASTVPRSWRHPPGTNLILASDAVLAMLALYTRHVSLQHSGASSSMRIARLSAENPRTQGPERRAWYRKNSLEHLRTVAALMEESIRARQAETPPRTVVLG